MPDPLAPLSAGPDLLPTQAPALFAPCRSLPDTPLHTCFSSESAESSPLDQRGTPDICISNKFLHVENQQLPGKARPGKEREQGPGSWSTTGLEGRTQGVWAQPQRRVPLEALGQHAPPGAGVQGEARRDPATMAPAPQPPPDPAFVSPEYAENIGDGRSPEFRESEQKRILALLENF